MRELILASNRVARPGSALPSHRYTRTKSRRAASVTGMATIPPVVQQSVLRWGNDHLRIMSLVASNVPGPQISLYLDGMPLVAYYPLMPLGAETALSIAVVTLVGVMGFGFSADWTAFPDLESLVRYAGDSFEDLRKAAAV